LDKDNCELMSIPEGISEYDKRGIDIDLKLLPGEEVRKVAGMSPISKLREYILSISVAISGYFLYKFFSSGMTMENMIPLVASFLTSYFIWHQRVTKDIKQLVWSIVKYSIYLLMFGYLVTFLSSYLYPLIKALSPLLPAEALGSLPKFSPDPMKNTMGILDYMVNAARSYLTPYSNILSMAGVVIVVVSIFMAVNTYLYARGRIYYITNKRIVIRQKYGTVQVTTLPMDSVVEVTAFQGLFGRVFGFGDIVVSMVSGGGVEKSLAPGEASLKSGLYSVKRRMEGVRDPWEIKDMILEIREKYVEANYLSRIEGELRGIRKGERQTELGG